jgi:hypothetical protein
MCILQHMDVDGAVDTNEGHQLQAISEDEPQGMRVNTACRHCNQYTLQTIYISKGLYMNMDYYCMLFEFSETAAHDSTL